MNPSIRQSRNWDFASLVVGDGRLRFQNVTIMSPFLSLQNFYSRSRKHLQNRIVEMVTFSSSTPTNIRMLSYGSVA
jgi:hypothetical protein